MFWNGSRWIDEQARPRGRRPRSALDWVAFTALGVALVGLLVPLSATFAGSPKLAIAPQVAKPGQQIRVTGAGVWARATVALQWDGSTAGMPTLTTSRNGAFSVSIPVSAAASPGVHTVSVQFQRWTTRRSTEPIPTVLIVSGQFTVADELTATAAAPSVAAPGPTTAVATPALAAATAGTTAAPSGTAAPAAQPTTDPTTPATSAPTPTAAAAPTAAPPSGSPPGPSSVPTAPPTPAPTPKPTATPTPSPSPTSGPSNPSCTATLAAGTGDRTSALKSLVDSVPNGSTICFEPGSHIVNGRVAFSNRSGLTFVGPATLTTSTTNRGNVSLFQANKSTNIVYRDLVVDGGRPDPGTYSSAHEYESAFDFRASSGTVDDVTIRDWGGDAVYVGAADSSAGSQSHDITIKNSVINGTGRMGIAITAGNNISIVGNSLDRIAFQAIDLEANYATHGATDILVSGNTVRRYGVDPKQTPWFFTADVTVGSADNLTIKNNTFVGSALTVEIGRWSGTRRSNVTITGNVSDFVGKSPAGNGGALIYLWHVDGVTVKNNTQPLASGHFLTNINDCTGVSVS